MDPVTLLIIGILLMVASIPTNSYALAGASVAVLFFSGILYFLPA